MTATPPRFDGNAPRSVTTALRLLRPLPDASAHEFHEDHAAQLAALLPLIGIAFGGGVLVLGLWDWLIAPAFAGTAFALRLLMVVVSGVAWFPNRLGLSPMQRWGWVYWADASALILAAYLLPGGLLHAMASIAASLFAVSVATLRARDFMLMQSGPAALFIATGALAMPRATFLGTAVLYFFSLLLAFLVMLVVRAFRQKAFLLEKQLLDVSRHDGLTGACNRSYLYELGQREVALARRKSRPLAVLMLDIDHFKVVNDTWGHGVGDRVLRALSDVCRDNLRRIDHFGRVGGEEFVCILPETDEAEALLCAERLRRAVEALRVEIGTPGQPLHFTISVGSALLASWHTDWEALLCDADAALYRAKDGGRNRVAVADRPPDVPSPVHAVPENADAPHAHAASVDEP